MLLSGFRGLLLVVLTLSLSHGALSQTAPATLPNCSRIMPLGDSITVGGNGGYRKELYLGLLPKNCSVSYVGSQYDQYTTIPEKLHEGHPFFTIDDISKGIDDWLASAQPNIILLMIGTNDIASWTNSTAAEIGARLNALLVKIRKARPDAWIFVASIPPMSAAAVPPNNIDRAVLDTEYNSVLRSLVEGGTDARIRFVDVNAALSVDDLVDGVHPKEAAQAKIAEKFLTALSAALEPGSTTPVAAPAPVPATPSPVPAPASSPTSAPATSPPAAAASSSGGAMDVRTLLCLFALLFTPLNRTKR